MRTTVLGKLREEHDPFLTPAFGSFKGRKNRANLDEASPEISASEERLALNSPERSNSLALALA